MKKIGLFVFVLLLSFSFALAIDAIPDYKDKYVNDFAGVLSGEQAASMRGLFAYVEENTTAEMTFVSVSECSPYAPGDLAVKIGNTWKVGKADKSNGFLILYCKAENKIYAASGYGVEGILPDGKIGRLLDENYVSLRDAGNVSQGIIAFSSAVAEVMNANALEITSGQAGVSQTSDLVIVVFAIIVFFLFGIMLYFVAKAGKKKGFGDFM
ncbi:MAG: TPM domain-containing protein, partial [archaeon]